MKQLFVFKFFPAHVSLMRALSWEGRDGYPYHRCYFLVRYVGPLEKVYFSLESFDPHPREYVRCVKRVIPLADYEAKALLVSCFFYESERAISVGSSWALRNQPNMVLYALENLFPDWKFVYDDYLSNARSQVEVKAELHQRLMLDRIEYDRCVKRSVFPRRALAPKKITGIHHPPQLLV